MKGSSRFILAAVCVFVFALPVAALPPDANDIGAPPHTGQDKSATEAAAMKALLQRARDAVLAAKKPADLDGVIFEMQKYQNNGFGFVQMVTPENQELVPQILSALEFAKLWQSYLEHTASGQTDAARNDLTQLSQANGPGLLPRSRILELLAAPAPPPATNSTHAAGSDAQKIVDGVQKLDDLEPALGQLNTLAAQDSIARDYAQHLAPMVEVYNDLKSGLPTSVNIDFMGDVTGAGISARANTLLLNFILQHYFDTYKGAPPGDTETPAGYTRRVLNDALAGQNWILLKKALNAHQYLARNVGGAGGASDNETAGFDEFITGINQQTARQFSMAVTSYLTALKAGNLDIPAKYIGEQLDAIKRDHPSDYDSGVAAYLTPQTPQMPPGMNPGLYYMMMQRYRAGQPVPPGFFPGGAPGPAPSPTLSIPGAATNAPPANAAPH
jgi:hypothetical protein